MKIAFVCTGNTCRSPLAEAFARHEFPEFEFSSFGLYAKDGQAASEGSKLVAEEYGLCLDDHRASALHIDILKNFDFIFCLTRAHRKALLELYPELSEKVKDFPSGDIPDPFGGTPEEYRHTADLIFSAVREALEDLK